MGVELDRELLHDREQCLGHRLGRTLVRL